MKFRTIYERVRATEAARVPSYFPKAKGYEPISNFDFGFGDHETLDGVKADFSPFLIWNGGKESWLSGNQEQERYSEWLNHEIEGILSNDEGERFLRLTGRADVDDNGSFLFSSGMIRTMQLQSFGLWEAEIAFDYGQAGWGAFWLLPQGVVGGAESGAWPPEIDIVENPYNDDGRDDHHSTFHGLKGKAQGAIASSRLDQWGAVRWGSALDTRKYVKYGMAWTPADVTIYVNGHPVLQQAFAWQTDDGKPCQPAHTMINLALGGSWPGQVKRSTFPAQVRVNYLRTWGNGGTVLARATV